MTQISIVFDTGIAVNSGQRTVVHYSSTCNKLVLPYYFNRCVNTILSIICIMLDTVLDSLQVRMLIPLEAITMSAIVIMASTERALADEYPSFILCGHEFARFPRLFYWTISFAALGALTRDFWNVILRLSERRQQSSASASATLMPCLRTNGGTTVVYEGYSSFVLYTSFSLAAAVLLTIMIGIKVPETYPASITIILILLLNLILGVTPRYKETGYSGDWELVSNQVIDFLTILATDDDYDDLRLQPLESFPHVEKDTSPGADARFQPPFDGAVLKIGRNDEMFVRCTGNSGIIRKISNWFSCTIKGRKWKICPSKPYSHNFRLIPLRAPFAIVWNSIYKAFGSWNGFKGAHDIKNCMLWLAIVSALTTTLIFIIPGPCVPVEDDDESKVNKIK